MFTEPLLHYLVTPSAGAILDRLAHSDLGDAHTLRLIETLRRETSAERAGALLELARLRLKAADKFGADAARMFFTREALEQASDPAVRDWRAGWARAGEPLLDACCSIGSDALAFARAGAVVTALDNDPVRAAMARLNAEALGLPITVQHADVTAQPLHAPSIFFDPARRRAERRAFHVRDYTPPLATVRDWRCSRLQAKLSPGVDTAELDGYGGLLWFVSVRGALKEAVLESAPDAQGSPLPHALLLGHGAPLAWQAPPAETRLCGPLGWLIEPDPALLRAGQVASAASTWNAWQMDATIAYLTADAPPDTPWARAWRVLEALPFSVKRLREALRTRGIGRVDVLKRGTAVTPDVLIPQLKLRGEGAAVVMLTRVAGAQTALICEAPRLHHPSMVARSDTPTGHLIR
jgi:hypothetical protein